MQLAGIQALAVGWLLTCLVEYSSAYPERPNRALPRVGIANNNPEIENRFQINYGRQDQGSADSGYESIDQFQLEQRRQPHNVPGKHEARYDYEDQYFNQFRNDQESHYQSLLRVTEGPLLNLQIPETFDHVQEPQSYDQDYLPLDENEGLKVEQYNSQTTQSDEMHSSQDLTENNKKEEGNSKNEEIAVIITKLLKENSYSPSLNDLEALNSLEDEMIAEASVPEEIKRGARHVGGQEPGFWWTLARLAVEKVNDTNAVLSQLRGLINENFAPDGTPTIVTTTSTTSSSFDDDDTSGDINVDDNATTTSTTEAPFRLTRTEFQGIIRRNVKGLIRLFRIEWRDALSQSQASMQEFQRDFRNQVRPYLEERRNEN